MSFETESLGLVLKDNVYQATFSYSVEHNYTPWRHPKRDQFNSAALLMRILPLKTIAVPALYACLVAMISVFVWMGLFGSLAVSQQEVMQGYEWW